MPRSGGWFGLACWNALSRDQQRRLVEHGNLPIGYEPEGPEGSCPRGAEIGVETSDDIAPGPRFYCRPCAIAFLQNGRT